MTHQTKYIIDFSEEIYCILKKYSGKNCNLMISGGSLLGILSSKDYGLLDTSRWKVFFADERANKDTLNFTQSQAFLKMLKAQIFKIEISDNLEKSAINYESILKNNCSHIDVCLLGIGENGHICSIWPSSKILKSERLVEPVEVDCSISSHRVTTTLEFINKYVKKLYFVVPLKDGKIKNIKMPHSSIVECLDIDFTIFLAQP